MFVLAIDQLMTAGGHRKGTVQAGDVKPQGRLTGNPLPLGISSLSKGGRSQGTQGEDHGDVGKEPADLVMIVPEGEVFKAPPPE
ncbi:hypothetical protein ACQP3J_28325, partial [Escherichia coli]